ncbi:DUF6252 family protein [Bernardetia sp. ABR2-2B]|uniref:DUF6252 family protein n=1 Tax=Bernardetia sp. ABR2-2B TaxID=3127472 RepID=UPI0030D4419C
MKLNSFSLANFSRMLILLLAITFVFLSCNNDEDDTNPEEEEVELAGGSMSAKVDGQNFKATTSVEGVISNNGILSVKGKSSTPNSLRQINFVILEYEVGTYSLSSGGNSAAWAEGSDQASLYVIESGEITITENTSTNIKGTFEFVSSNIDRSKTRTITEGKFDVKI